MFAGHKYVIAVYHMNKITLRMKLSVSRLVMFDLFIRFDTYYACLLHLKGMNMQLVI